MSELAGDGPDPRNVFVVHGRNDALKRAMFDFLRAINLNPMSWSEGIALTETGAPYVGEILDAMFAQVQAVVVLLTPDEITYLQPSLTTPEDPETQPAPQARPNVLLEAGMALGRHPRHTILVEVGEMRPFSDITGRHAIRLTNAADKRQDLANRLKTAGCDVRTVSPDWLSTGDFTAPEAPGKGLPLGRRTPSTRAARAIDFDAKYYASGNRGGRLQVINRGLEAAYDVRVRFPENAALTFLNDEPVIPKLPGGGKSVNLTVWHEGRTLGSRRHANSFEATISARTESGDDFSQDVFIDANEG